MKNSLLIVAVLAGGAGWLGAKLLPLPALPDLAAAHATERAAASYQCPMHPWVKADKAADCTICGMKLVLAEVPANNPATATSQPAGLVRLSPASIAVAGVRTVPVSRQPLLRTLRLAGVLGEDESQHAVICAPVDGRVDGLAMSCSGQTIHEQQAYATLFSRTLLETANIYRLAVTNPGPALEAASRALLQLGLMPQQIATIPTRQPEDVHFGLLAQVAGTIVKSYVSEGQYVYKGEKLFELADLNRLWLVLNIPAQDVPFVHWHQKVLLTTPSLPGEVREARADYVEPSLDEMTHSARVRVVVENRDGRYHLNMLVEAGVETEEPAVLTVPRSAVLWPGKQPRVYVEAHPGTYAPRAVKLGRAGDTDWEVLEGLQAGEAVVVAGNLLLDSQAQMDSEARGTTPGMVE